MILVQLLPRDDGCLMCKQKFTDFQIFLEFSNTVFNCYENVIQCRCLLLRSSTNLNIKKMLRHT